MRLVIYVCDSAFMLKVKKTIGFVNGNEKTVIVLTGVASSIYVVEVFKS